MAEHHEVAELIAKRLTNAHCWHPTGSGTSTANGGSESDYCCFCGNWSYRTYTINNLSDPMHGMYFTATERVWQGRRLAAHTPEVCNGTR